MEMLRKNNSQFSGYLAVADDMIILPNRLATLDKGLVWSNPTKIGDLQTGM